ncbi:protein argonaute-2-like [Tropilaelaps mercedesae]|uniref:Protein argonaute-2-like n=1 Tax=Tropilaelaps mercedesae TaxID=418985 RepID=A0A1V9XSW4_9ACAR|nr:protein argonaute-2-like [Tropilaelaps mercedesae]
MDSAIPCEVLEDVKSNVDDVEMTLVMLNPMSNYGLIKATAETLDLCLRRQCVKDNNVNNEKKFNSIFAQNLLRKMNTKLGGCIYLNIYPNNSVFIQPRLQNKGGSRVEWVLDLDRMFLECLKEFQTRNSCLPEHLVIYRDGVSEGQFDAVHLSGCARSLPAPVYYVHLVACRTREHIKGVVYGGRSADLESNTSFDTSIDLLKFSEAVKVTQKMCGMMYFV